MLALSCHIRYFFVGGFVLLLLVFRFGPRALVCPLSPVLLQTLSLFPKLLAVSTVITISFANYSRPDLERGDRLLVEGIAQHPYIVTVSDVTHADFVICMPWSEPRVCSPFLGNSKLIVVDYGDSQLFTIPLSQTFLTFKRSIVIRRRGYFHHMLHGPNLYPIQYGVQRPYVFPKDEDLSFPSRSINVYCSLRHVQKEHEVHGGARKRALVWLKQLQKLGSLRIVISVDSGTAYYSMLRRARIVVTAMPRLWEGDSRLWEALSAGALVFTDPVITPQPPTITHGVHVIFFDSGNQTDFYYKLRYYLSHVSEAAAIARRGWLLARNYHSALNRADYLFWTAMCYRRHSNHSMCTQYPIGMQSPASTLLNRPVGNTRYGNFTGPHNG